MKVMATLGLLLLGFFGLLVGVCGAMMDNEALLYGGLLLSVWSVVGIGRLLFRAVRGLLRWLTRARGADA